MFLMLNNLTIHEASEGLRTREFSSFELTNACLERIKKVDPKVKAYTLVEGKLALLSAKKADEELSKGAVKNPLHGIPAALKDVFCTEGIRTTACSNILKNFVPPYDATVVKRLKNAGIVLLGKTNTDEFTCGGTTETSCFGTTHNPWNLDRTPGGSSGGSAAAVACGRMYLCARNGYWRFNSPAGRILRNYRIKSYIRYEFRVSE